MRYQLFYALGSASMGVRAMLEEIGADYELIPTTIDRDKPRPAEQLCVKSKRLGAGPEMGRSGYVRMRGHYDFLCDRHPEAQLRPSPGESGRHVFCRLWFTSQAQSERFS